MAAIIERFKELYSNRKSRFLSNFISAVIVFVILASLQPFGINEIEDNKYLIVAGYGVITFFLGLFIDVILCLFWTGGYPFWNWRSIIHYVLMTIFMGAAISTYSAIVFKDDWHDAWFYGDNVLYLDTFYINTLYSAIISFFILFINWFDYRNKNLQRRLEEEIELNKLISSRGKNVHGVYAPIIMDQMVTLKGSTKDCAELAACDLIYAESKGNYVDVVFRDGMKTVRKTIRITMKQVEESFDKFPHIIRCHRAFLVNVKKVAHVSGNSQGYRLNVDGTDNEIPVSRAYASTIYESIESD